MSNFDAVRPVLRLWSYADAPPEFRQALAAVRKDCWVAHAPPDLMQEDVLALFQVYNLGMATIRAVRLPDGSGLFAGPFPVQAAAQSRASWG
jgi:hypothetical protein